MHATSYISFTICYVIRHFSLCLSDSASAPPRVPGFVFCAEDIVRFPQLMRKRSAGALDCMALRYHCNAIVMP